MIVPRLPVLTALNKEEFPEWHRYYERVYHGEVPDDATIDLNEFTWFYWGCPLDVKPAFVPLLQAVRKDEAWSGDYAPESHYIRIGFFVRREPLPTPASFIGSRFIEVLHMAYAEVKASWFYAVKGSGIFLDTEAFPMRKVVVTGRRELEGYSRNWKETSMWEYMHEQKISVLVIAHSWTSQSQRSEVVAYDPDDVDQAMEGCPFSSSKLRTGPRAEIECFCDRSVAEGERGWLNCGAKKWRQHPKEYEPIWGWLVIVSFVLRICFWVALGLLVLGALWAATRR